MDLAMVSAALRQQRATLLSVTGPAEHLIDQMFNPLISTRTEGRWGEGAGSPDREPGFPRPCWEVFYFPFCALENQIGT